MTDKQLPHKPQGDADLLDDLTVAELRIANTKLKADAVEAITAPTQHRWDALALVLWLWHKRSDHAGRPDRLAGAHRRPAGRPYPARDDDDDQADDDRERRRRSPWTLRRPLGSAGGPRLGCRPDHPARRHGRRIRAMCQVLLDELEAR
jgi:hypothetical protein